ncbi:2-dehydro-3-deoxyphosphooctonate aldolase [Flavicella sp.]|uniref:2-dehydro-3-deoxyphosphooctonate aldolase n=1 Tax=Flavicella sp. TaxID=2957742 RepID=UPI0026112023|nr:2-dehydro-3-deoxyphosphooctonate aldolase [Flavicella sp.]MDG1805171.1 2-dehydro-3-deoxyphosphooctonate aldolase [Flavicella sp.]MDG2280194.1 2-dehydro-3-deoxyphosphooctonate aldolase [Flavicella sp.]
MKKNVFTIVLLVFFSCSSSKKAQTKENKILESFVITEVSRNKSYGLTPKNPVEVGGSFESGACNERRYLNLLTGPNGEMISYYRAGSCCPIKSENGFNGMAMLDNYRVTWENSKDTISIYINLYDKGELKVPIGFGFKNPQVQFLEQ